MRHRLQKRSSFGVKPGPRLALIRGLAFGLVEHERIKTTLARAKELRRRVERAVTIGKAGDTSARRVLFSRFPNKKTISKITDQLSKRFKNRNGGYTRIIKLGKRSGDAAEMAYLEFVDYDPAKKPAPSELKDKKTEPKNKKQTQKKKSSPLSKKTLSRKAFKDKKKRKKRLRKIQSQSRRTNRS